MDRIRVVVRFKSLTNIFLVLLFVSQCSEAWNEEYLVQGRSLNFHRHDIVTLDRERRDVPAPAPAAPAANVTPAVPAAAVSKDPAVASTPAPPTLAVSPPGNAEANNTANTTEKAASNTSAPTVTQHQLGVNGSGIRKDVVSDPISPDDSFPDVFKETPDTIKSEHNLTNLTYDNHDFYNSSFIGNVTYFNEYWANISKPEPQIHQLLSNSYRRANTIQLSFPFPYYGHFIRTVTLATGGFMFIGEHVHNWIAATQYIAPLMGNFDTSLDNDSYVKLYDDGEKFTVFWENVTLREDQTKKFTFASTLYKNGDIVFAYKSMPMEVQAINDQNHPVKVGISDAYVGEKNLFNVRSKTIYEYHRVSFKNHAIANNTILRLTALPTCIQYNACDSCLNHNTGFNCTWCPQANKCSSGTDINKQNWKLRQCPETSVTEASACPPVTGVDAGGTRTLSDTTVYTTDDAKPDAGHSKDVNTTLGAATASPSLEAAAQQRSPVGGAVAAFVAVALVCSLAVWVLYAFKNPHTRSGQLLIKYRPSQWNWRRGEARYTAATIHM
ncbi:hypothetical protein O3G_MSEX004015 [Manduca sexta]|uniref:PSI domain-containing protein n=1 Tax=Manduca sexta TaxID=7130 RepID=A0A922CGR0_MANSE|nr:hypothetical protein O3G_MSEX004015 [Manduca sexta]